jgi:hypothetical protein
MNCRIIKFSGHAIRRIFERKIKREWIIIIIESGEIIEEYTDDIPYPSYLMLGFIEKQPLHVVVVVNKETKTCHIVTVYIPDKKIWQSDFKTRRKK